MAKIKRLLKLSSNKTGENLKRRLQIFLTELQPIIKERMVEDIKAKPVKLPVDKPGQNIKRYVKGKPVVHADVLVMFSAGMRSNGFRARSKFTGTSSIYLSDAVAMEKGKWQVGSLVHTMAIPGGPVLLEAVRDTKQLTLKPLFDFLPKGTAVFTDQGYPWLKRERNLQHRAVNHSAKAKDGKRFKWSKDRWSRDGAINNNAAEGFQRTLKANFVAGYSYISPEYMPLYLAEYSSLKAIRVYGLEVLLGGGLATIPSSRKRVDRNTCKGVAFGALWEQEGGG